MVKIKGTYRLQETTILEIQEMREMIKKNEGVDLSDSQIIERAIYKTWLQTPNCIGGKK